MMRYKSIIEKFCRDNSGIVKMIKTIFLFGFLVVFVLFVLLLQNSNLNIEESIFNSINIVSKLILLIVAINFIIRRKMENDIVTSKLTSSELKEILAGVPMSYYMNSSTARQNWSNITSFIGVLVGIVESPLY